MVGVRGYVRAVACRLGRGAAFWGEPPALPWWDFKGNFRAFPPLGWGVMAERDIWIFCGYFECTGYIRMA